MNSVIVRVVVASLLFVSLTQPARAEWYEASSDHFVIYADDKDADIRRFSENLERYHSAMAYLMKREVDLPSPSIRVTIYVVGGEKEMRSLSGSRTIGGFYIDRHPAPRICPPLPDVLLSLRHAALAERGGGGVFRGGELQ